VPPIEPVNNCRTHKQTISILIAGGSSVRQGPTASGSWAANTSTRPREGNSQDFSWYGLVHADDNSMSTVECTHLAKAHDCAHIAASNVSEEGSLSKAQWKKTANIVLYI
jgi:hypothetical protein